MKRKKIFIILAAVFFLILSLVLFKINSKKIYLYAWDRPENFSFLENKIFNKPTIVFLAGSIVLHPGSVEYTNRKNTLITPKNIVKLPVIRIDDSGDNEFSKKTEEIRKFIVEICKSYPECQLDFDAKESQYGSYRDLISKVKANLPDTKISLTALASWCAIGSWLDNMPAAYAVPMLYRLGEEESAIKKGIDGSWFMANKLCKDNIAFSTDELNFNFRQYIKGRNVFLFNPEPWTENEYHNVIAKF